MFDRIIKFSLNNRSFVLFAGLALMLWGGWIMFNLPIDFFQTSINQQLQF